MSTAPSNRHHKRILLVEDEAIIALSQTRVLERHGYEVTRTYAPDQAIAAAMDGEIDLVLMDIDLGHLTMDGTDVASAILAERSVPIVFLTGHDEAETVARVKGITRYGYVLKSSGEFVLLEAIAMAFDLFEAHRQAAEALQRYEWIAASTSDGIAVLENDVITYVSPSYIRMLGYTPAETQGIGRDEILARIHPEDRPRIASAIDAAHRSRTSYFQYWYRARRKDGEYIWIEDRVRAFYDDAGRPTKSLVNGREITQPYTERRTLEERLEAVTTAKSRDELLAEYSRDYVTLWDSSLTAVYVAPSVLKFLGYTAEEYLKKQALTIIHADDRRTVEDHIKSAIAENREFSTVRYRVRCKNGDVLWVEARARLMYDADGALNHIVVNHSDVTEEENAKRELEESRRHLQEVFRHLGEGVALYRPVEEGRDFEFVELNDVGLELGAKTRDEAIGRRVTEVFPGVKEMGLLDVLRRVSENRVPEDHPVTLYADDTVERLVENHVFPVGRDLVAAVYVDVAHPRAPEAAGGGRLSTDRDEHYLKTELYDLVQRDRSVFDFLQSGSLDGIWYWDMERPENEWMSPGFWELLGFDPAEKRHDPSEWQELIDSNDRQVALDNLTKHLADPSHPYDQVVRYRHKDGRTMWVRCRGIAIRDETGKPIRVLGAHNDLTELERSVQNEKLMRRELNHRVKNNLALVRSLLNLKQAEMGEAADLSDVVRQVDTVRVLHETLQDSENSASVPLKAYLRRVLCAAFSPSYGFEVSATLTGDELELPGRAAVSLGLVVNELASNAAKHGFSASAANEFSVHLAVDPTTQDRCTATIRSSGKPFPAEVPLPTSESLGLRLVSAIVSQIRGTLTLERHPSPVFTITFPTRSAALP